MPSLNRITLMGHIGQDAETKFTPSGMACTKFSLATTHSYKKNDEWVETTDWHNIVAWRVHEKTLPNLTKGVLVYVEGRVSTRTYEKDGEKRWITEIIAERTWFLRQPFRTGSGPRDEEAPPERQTAPISDDDMPF